MSLVRIPTSHFVQSAKRQYSDIDTAIIREAIQNSVDAGSTRIEIEVGENFCRVKDNGCGMSIEVLESALLTMSGTHKSYSGAIGGFGAAKEILLFQHASYEILTLDNHVKGSVLEYELTKQTVLGEPYQGTIITMNFHESYNFDKDTFDYKAKQFLSKCDVEADITYNGEIIPRYIVQTMIKDIDWAQIYCEDSTDEHEYLAVRIKGVLMFEYFVAKGLKKKIVLDITKPSVEILCANRDSLQWDPSQQLQKLVREISVDKQSFGRLHKTISRFKGKNSRSFINEILKPLMNSLIELKNIAGEEIEENIALAHFAVQDIQSRVELKNIEESEAVQEIKNILARHNISGIGEKFVDEKMENFINNVDFYIQINDEGYDSIPDEIAPTDKMKPKYRKMGQMWKASLAHVFKSNGMNAEYCLGWIVDKTAVAGYLNDDGIEKFFLNPYHMRDKKFKNKKEMMTYMLLSAAHEVAHRTNSYHDERFTAHVEEIMFKTFSAMSSYKEIIKNAEKESI
jgi:hypothetical protein